MSDSDAIKIERFVDEASNHVFGLTSEMTKQFKRWGEQNHPSYPKDSTKSLSITSFLERTHHGGQVTSEISWNELAEQTKKHNDFAEENGRQAWSNILLEELWEALDEDDPQKRIHELHQVAGVALQWAMSIERNEISEA